MPHEAVVFLFTDWHQGTPGRSLDDWAPFGSNKPPDTHTIQAIKVEVNRRLNNILATDFPPEEKMEFDYLHVGPEVIDSKSKDEPKWEELWGAIVDRAAATGNSDKLRKMALRMAKAKESTTGRGKHLAALFVTPEGGAKTLEPLNRHQQSFDIFHTSDYLELVIVIAGWLVSTTQRVDTSQVHDQMNKIY
jgi:hypothetical protein